MLVRAYDPLSADKPKFSQNLRGIVDEVISFSYTRRAYDIGSFEMTIPSSEDAKQIIVPGVIIIAGDVLKYSYIVDTTQKTISNNAFYVTSVTDTDDETIHVTGYDLKYLLSFRITLFPQEEQDKGTYGYYVTKGDTFHCVSDLINYNLANASDEKRRIFGFGRLVMPTAQIEAGLTGIADDRYMTRLEPLSTAVFNLLKNCKTHFWEVRVMIDEQSDQPDGYVPRMESGEDKTPLIITPDLYNISAYDKTEDVSAYKNVLYAVSNDGSSTKALVQAVSKDTTSDSGITRKEVVVDVDAESIEDIPTYALKSGEEYEIADDFEVTPIFDDNDMLSPAQPVIVKLGNHTYTSIITEITDEYSDNGHTCSFVVGNKKIKVLNVLNKAIANTNQRTINNKLVLSGAANIDTAIVLQERELQRVVHNYTEIGYVAGNSVGYGGAQNSIICNGYELSVRDGDITTIPRYKHVEFPKGYNFQTSSWKKDSVSDIVIEAVLTEIDQYMKKSVSVRYMYTDDETGKRLSWGITNNWTISAEEDFCFSPCWTEIHAPTSTFPYGYINIVTYPYKIKSSGELVEQYIAFGANIDIPFASETEYNAAVGLTNTPIELIKLQDFQYLVPESQIIVDKELSPDSDNVIANSTVAKALELKADKETVETLSLVVDSKADIIEVDALSQKVDSKADSTEVQSIAQAVEGKAESSDLTAHIGNADNPHGVTKEQIGLSKVEDKSSSEILSELQIHGRNYIVDSGKAVTLEGKGLETSATKNMQYPDIETAESLDGKTVTISFDYENNVTEGQCDFRRNLSWGLILRFTPEQNTGKGSHKLTFTMGDYEHTNTAAVYLQGAFSGSITIRNLKLELGDKATDWSVAPEDVVRLEQRVATLEAAMLSLGGEV